MPSIKQLYQAHLDRYNPTTADASDKWRKEAERLQSLMAQGDAPDIEYESRPMGRPGRPRKPKCANLNQLRRDLERHQKTYNAARCDASPAWGEEARRLENAIAELESKPKPKQVNRIEESLERFKRREDRRLSGHFQRIQQMSVKSRLKNKTTTT